MRTLHINFYRFFSEFSSHRILRIYTFFTFFRGFILSFFFALYPLYLTSTGISNEKIGFLFAIMPLVMFIFEIPTGVLGDVIGRKSCLMLNVGINLLAQCLIVLLPSFLIFFIAELLQAIALTFSTGNLQAWLIDNAKSEGIDKPMIFFTSTLRVISVLGIAAGVFLAGLFGRVNIIYPMYVGVFLNLLFFMGSLFLLYDNHRTEQIINKGNFIHKMVDQLKNAFTILKQNKKLAIIFIVTFFIGLGMIGPFIAYWQQFMTIKFDLQEDGIGLISMLMKIAGFLILLCLPFLITLFKTNELFFKVSLLVLSISFALVSSMQNFYGSIIFFIIAYFFYSSTYSVASAIINSEIGSDARATILSSYSQVFTLGSASGGILSSIIVKNYTMDAVWIASSAMIFFGFLVCLFLKGPGNSN